MLIASDIDLKSLEVIESTLFFREETAFIPVFQIIMKLSETAVISKK